MTILVPIALLGWVPAVLVLFALLPPRRAIIAAFLIGWLFLPMAGFEIRGIPNFTKVSATAIAVSLGILLFDAGCLRSFRAAWYDLPMAIWLIVPMASSLHNGYGIYDGVSSVVDQSITWGVPYFIGRLYFNNAPALRELAIGIVLGGLVYVPLCLYEIRMSPQLHTMVYGFHQHVFAQSMRGGGWRPTVFMQHGLAVGMWMAVASMLGVWLWQTGALRRIRSVPMSLLLVPLLMTTVLCKSIGALALLLAGVSALSFTKLTRSAQIMIVLLLLAPVYLTARTAFQWDAMSIAEAVEQSMGDRARSLETRLVNEQRILQVTLQRPVFGWGTWGGYRDVDDADAKVVTDSLWILALGQHGFVGLLAVVTVILLPAALFAHRTRMRLWHLPVMAPAAGLAVIMILFMIDSLFNSMFNPIYLLAGGGLAGLTAGRMRVAINSHE